MKKIIISLFILIILCLLTYILIKSNFDYTSNKYFKYFLIITISLIFFIFLFFAKEKIQEIFLILFISTLFALYSVEVSMPLFVDGLYNKYQFSKSRKKLIKNYNQFKSYYPGGYPSWSVGLINKNFSDNLNKDIFIFSGIPNKITYHCSETKDYFEPNQIYKSDRYGFNNPDYVYNEKEIEIVLIGDSFVHGSCVNQDKGFAGNLRNLYKKKGIISIGWRGAGPLKELGMLTEYGIKLRPKNILWVYFEGNDYIELVREKKYKILENYLNLNFSQNLFERQDEIESILIKQINENINKRFKLDWHDENVILSYLIHRAKLWNIRWNFFYRKNYTPNKNDFDFEKFKKVLSVAKFKAEKNGSNFIFVYQPEKFRYLKKNINHENHLNKSKIIDIVNSLSIPIIDIHEIFIKETNPLDLWVAHTNEEGYKKASEYIFEKMRIINN